MKFFIAYTLQDNVLKPKDFNSIIEKLSEHTVFIHFFNPHIDSHEKIKEKILDSDVLLLVKTELTYKSKWVLDELLIASKAEIPLFCIDIEDIRNS